MNPLQVIEKFYKKDSDLYKMLIEHSTNVKDKAVAIALNHTELNLNINFIREAAMLHDIGIKYTYAPDIYCHGILPYICHGYIGREMLDELGHFRHALVCERHTGVGITGEEIIKKEMPLPHRDMLPISLEEKVICFADCFFSKTELSKEYAVEKIRKKLAKFGNDKVKLFDEYCLLFL